MHGVIITLNYDGTRHRLETNDWNILKEVQYIVGGYIQEIPGFDTYAGYQCVAFCNEEGKIKELPVNFMACKAWYEAMDKKGLKTVDVLCGNVAVVYGDKEFMRKI